MNKELISVIVPVFNVEKYLERCVETIVNQTYKNLEIILVNDGSTDNSGELCDELAKKDNRIKVVHKENGGLSDARNTGERESTGEYIIFIDSDDYIHHEMLNTLYTQIVEKNADVSICGVMNVYSNSETPQCSDINMDFVCDKEGFLKEYLIGEKIPGSICNKLLKKSIADKLEFPVGKIYEDAFYHYDLINYADKYAVSTKPYYYYFHRGDSITTKPYREIDLVYIDIYKKYYDLISKKYRGLLDEAFFRLSYAHFFILDKMLLEKDYRKLDHYKEVVSFLKKNAIKISKNTIFRRNRRIAALVLFVNVKLYRKLLFSNIENSKRIHE